ncbi:MAG TPA: sugar phosphate isomerase/epimerase family protein [Gemmatirosa sp.]
MIRGVHRADQPGTHFGLLGQEELTASYFTLTGAKLGEPPRHSLQARAAAAGAAGFTALALAPYELVNAREHEHGLESLSAIVTHHGLTVTELEPLRGWDGDDGELGRAQEQMMYEMADTFGSRQINAIQVEAEVSLDTIAERFAAVCDRAAAHGVTVAFEPRANSPVSSPSGAMRLLSAAGRVNSRIVLDCYHVHRGGVTLEDIAAVPTAMIASVQLNDMRAVAVGSALEDATEHRLAPGEGDIDLAAWLGGLADLGIDVPLSVEVMSRDFTEISIEQAARRAANGAREVLSAARAASERSGSADSS